MSWFKRQLHRWIPAETFDKIAASEIDVDTAYIDALEMGGDIDMNNNEIVKCAAYKGTVVDVTSTVTHGPSSTPTTFTATYGSASGSWAASTVRNGFAEGTNKLISYWLISSNTNLTVNSAYLTFTGPKSVDSSFVEAIPVGWGVISHSGGSEPCVVLAGSGDSSILQVYRADFSNIPSGNVRVRVGGHYVTT